MQGFHFKCLLCVSILLMTGCAKVPPSDDASIRDDISDRIEKDVHWNRDCTEDDYITNYVDYLLSKDITIDSAVQVALLNNPGIQADFEKIGIAHADLVNAGLFQNPLFDAFFRFPDRSSLSLNTEFAITQAFLDILLVPLRQKIAASEFEKVKLKVANSILNLAFDVQTVYYALAAEQTRYNLMESYVDATEAANQLAFEQKERGNINVLELQIRTNEVLQSKLELSQSRLEIIKLKEQMNRLLGLDSAEICWQIDSNLPSLPNENLPLECLEEVAFSRRLDLQAARWEVETIIRMGAVRQWWAYTDLAGGFAGEVDLDGTWTRGPAISGAIPIFNYGQGDRERLLALYRQSLDRLKALEVSIASEVRSDRDRLIVHRDLVLSYQNELLPLQNEVVNTSQSFYNVMALSVYKLLSVKKQEVQIQIHYALALKNYWISRVELDRALGGNLVLVVGDENK